MIVILYRIYT